MGLSSDEVKTSLRASVSWIEVNFGIWDSISKLLLHRLVHSKRPLTNPKQGGSKKSDSCQSTRGFLSGNAYGELYYINCSWYKRNRGLVSSRSTSMASPIDRFKTLPPELRECVYSRILPGEGDDTVQVRQRLRSKNNSRSTDDLVTVLAMREDPKPVAYQKKPIQKTWTFEVDEAFFRGL